MKDIGKLNLFDILINFNFYDLLSESFTRLDIKTEPQTVGNYSGGEQVGDSWTDKIMQLKLSDSVESASGAGCIQGGSTGITEGMGADEDEWVSVIYFLRLILYFSVLYMHKTSQPSQLGL